jgi:hypothetical protein
MQTSFDDLIESGKKVYVVNNTEPRGLLLCTVIDALSGKPQKIEFHRTWIPFCLTDRLPRETLQKSIELRRYIDSQLLKLVPEDEAQRMLSSPRGQAEYRRLHHSVFSKGSAMTDAKRSLIESTKHQNDGGAHQVNPSVQYLDLNLHPRIKAWEHRVSTGELNGITLVNELETHRLELTEQDMNYLVAGNFPQEVKEFASEALGSQSFNKEPRSKTPESAPPRPAAYEPDWG